MTTILDKIHLYIPIARSLKANAFALGHLEITAYRESFRQLYQIELPPESMTTGQQFYRGFRLIPVNLPHFFAVVTVHQEDVDASVKPQNA